MDYETPDGSRFSLVEIWTDDEENPTFRHTSISAFVEGKAYCGKLDARINDIDDAEVLNALETFENECIHPPSKESYTKASEFDPSKHYLKAPSFTWEDCRPGQTFVADCFLNEVKAFEQLKQNPHPNIVPYHGCVVQDHLVTQICLSKMTSSLSEYAERGLDDDEIRRVAEGIESGIKHLHSLGLAHNDINMDNICLDESGKPFIIDFDSCLPFGERLLKGVTTAEPGAEKVKVSKKENDDKALFVLLDTLLRTGREPYWG